MQRYFDRCGESIEDVQKSIWKNCKTLLKRPENKENKKLLENYDLQELKLEIEMKEKEEGREHKHNIERMKIEAAQQKLM